LDASEDGRRRERRGVGKVCRSRRGRHHHARDRHPARRAGHHRRLHRGVHADARQLPDAHSARWQELAVVHRADLQPVHHALQLGAGSCLRLPAARPVHRHGVVRAQGERPALQRRDATHMIPTLPRPAWLRLGTALYVGAFLVFLFLPLVTVAVFAFNNAPYPAPPWHGFTLDWFLGNEASGRVGLFHDSDLLASVWTSTVVACWVTALAVGIGTANAFLMERARFPGKGALSLLMLTPLVIPGVILGISILAFASRIADFLSESFGLEADFLRPGLPLVVLGQFSFIAAIATLTISAPKALRPHARGGG